MTVSQLERSIPIVAGDGISWMYEQGNQSYPLFFYLGPTLGRADYIRRTEEPALTDALYVKFMTDMALDVCRRMGAEPGGALVRFEDVDENLAYLHLRFLGERPSTNDIAALRAVYESDGDGWTAVCVALMTSPAFHIY